eukprot:TRINITY_DN10751_c0_g1_i2.p1 TRINITY_DN10751_c0_g1~~TRINITY_DN10751_c0_g1_i2.p1  ORF type:complete len:647 (-),score=102.38 TRINITY_DN10751_c0_g1_i2:30-1970(-)
MVWDSVTTLEEVGSETPSISRRLENPCDAADICETLLKELEVVLEQHRSQLHSVVQSLPQRYSGARTLGIPLVPDPAPAWTDESEASESRHPHARGRSRRPSGVPKPEREVVDPLESLSVVPATPSIPGQAPEELPESQNVKDEDTSERTYSERAKKRATRLHFLASIEEQESERLLLSPLQRFASSRAYEHISAFLVISNAFLIGWQTHYLAEKGLELARTGQAQDSTSPTEFLGLQIFYCLAFALELGIRWYAQGFFEFLRGDEVAWNVLDITIVFVAVCDTFIEILVLALGALDRSPLGNLVILRVLRVFRVVRIFRMIRVMRFFKELRMMVFSILGCMKSLLWVAMTLGLMWFVFAIVFVAAALNHLEESAMYHHESNRDLIECFGTVTRATLTLFMAMSGGNDWGKYYEAISATGWVYSVLFLFYIILAVFAVVNVVTGVFVDSAIESGRTDMDMQVAEELYVKRDTLQSLRTLFEELTTNDADGMLSETEFESALQNDNVTAFFRLLKLEFSQARDLFTLLDYDGSGKIDADEFVDGCYSLLGEASVFDQRLMQSEVHFLKGAVYKLSLQVNHAIDLIQSQAESRQSEEPQKVVRRGKAKRPTPSLKFWTPQRSGTNLSMSGYGSYVQVLNVICFCRSRS